jgi:hypothetical protein
MGSLRMAGQSIVVPHPATANMIDGGLAGYLRASVHD